MMLSLEHFFQDVPFLYSYLGISLTHQSQKTSSALFENFHLKERFFGIKVFTGFSNGLLYGFTGKFVRRHVDFPLTGHLVGNNLLRDCKNVAH